MQKVILFILVICFALSLYSFCFHPGKVLSFEKAYTNAMEFATTTGNIFAKAKDTVTNGIQTVLSLPAQISEFFGNFFEKIGEFFGNFGENIGKLFETLTERIRQFFVGITNRIAKFFKIETTCTCPDPENCTDCKCEAGDCPCSIGRGGSRGSR